MAVAAPVFTSTNATSIWPTWVRAGSTTSSSTTANFIWTGWVSSTNSTTFATGDVVWRGWQADWQYVYTPVPQIETPEERVARLDREQAAREEASRRRLAEQARLEGAQERGMELLLTILTDEERRYHDAHDEILVRAPSGRMYVIGKHGVHGNISETDEHGCFLGRVCVAPGMYDYEVRQYLPLADGWLGQYLAIKHNEEHLRATGNWSSRQACAQPEVPVLRAA